MATIISAEFVAPPMTACSAAQAAEVNHGYQFLLDEGATSFVPFATGFQLLRNRRPDTPLGETLPYRLPSRQRFRLAPARGTMIAVAPPDTSACDLGLAAARTLVGSLGTNQRGAIEAVIYCHNALDERINDASSGRVACELDLAGRMAFGVTQVHNCGVFAAMQLASGLIEGTEALSSVLIVAADKWLHPYVRGFGLLGCFGDGGGALLVGRDSDPGFEIVHLEVALAKGAPFVFDSPEPINEAPIADQVAEVIALALGKSGFSPCDVDLVIPQNYSESLISRVNAIARLGRSSLYLGGLLTHGHLSSADPIANLAGAATTTAFANAGLVLLWGAGLNGEAACCLLRPRRGA